MLFLSILLSIISLSYSSIFKPQVRHPQGYSILDLIQSEAEVAAFAHEWKVENFAISNPHQPFSCMAVSFLGGHEISPPAGSPATLSRTYASLPAHYYATISITMLLLDDWSTSDSFLIQIDDWSSSLMVSSAVPQDIDCIDTLIADSIIAVSVKMKHSQDSLSLKISASSSQPYISTSFAISTVTVNLYKNPTGPFTPSLTNQVQHSCTSNSCPGSGVCYFYENTGSCVGCAMGCFLCAEGNPSQCFSCTIGYSFDGEQCFQCHQDCAQCLNVNECIKCKANFVLDLDKTCKTTCSDSSIAIGDVNLQVCVKPCPPGQILLWNYTCADSCEPPLIKLYEAPLGDFCEFPCNSMEYLYWDGSCLESCPSEDIRFEGEKKFCEKPKETSTNEEGGGEGTIASLNTNAGKVATLGLAITSLFSIGNPVRILSGSLKQMLEYTKYLNITHSEELARLFKDSDTSSMSVFPTLEMSDELMGKFPKHRLPYMFEKFELDSSFFLNYWENIFQYCILIGVLLLLIALDLGCRRLRNIGRTHFWIKRGKLVMANYIVGQYYEEVGEVVFNTGLQFYGMDKPDSGYSYLSLLTPIACLILGAIVFTVNWKFVQKYFRIKSSKKKSEKEILKELTVLKTNYQSLQILYEEFEDITRSHQAYLLILQTRSILFNIVIVFLSHSPHVQVFLIILTHFIILGYFAIKKPLKSMINLVQMTLFEISLLIVNLSWLIMAIIDTKENIQSTLREVLSDVVIKMNLVFTFIPFAFFAIQLVQVLKEVFEYFRQRRERKKVDPKPETQAHERSNDSQEFSLIRLTNFTRNSEAPRLKIRRKSSDPSKCKD